MLRAFFYTYLQNQQKRKKKKNLHTYPTKFLHFSVSWRHLYDIQSAKVRKYQHNNLGIVIITRYNAFGNYNTKIFIVYTLITNLMH